MNQYPKNLISIAPVLQVANIPRSLAFYGDLSFTVDFIHEDFYAGISRDGCHIHLKHSDRPPCDRKSFEQNDNIDVCISVANAAELSATFAAAKIPFVVSLRQMPYGAEFYIRDPDGYILGFVQATSS